MGIIVQKFGGTSVGSVERIQNVANRVVEEKEKGNHVVVVVSAMGKTTDSLVNLAKEITENPTKREMDMLLTTGEQVTISLLTMALIEKGYEAISYTGGQAGIQTEPHHGNARIVHIDPAKIENDLHNHRIVVVAGFQGITEAREVTTLGRGGSDTTAVALAAALSADRCEIYTDVDGVYTSDPRYVKRARKLESVSYDEMLELANLGAGVLHPRAVEFAKNYHIPLEVRSSLQKDKGTIIEEEITMEQGLIVRGVAFEDEITRMTVFGIKNPMTSMSSIFSKLARHHINVDIIIQSQSEANHTNLSFSIKHQDLQDALEVLEKYREELGFTHIEHESRLAKVSIVGSGMISNPGVAAQMFDVLASNDIIIKMVSTSEIKVSVVIDEDKMVNAAQVLHETFQLDQVATPEEIYIK
ncbi:aspartate kinase [Bacillus pakistanensis]|uniref:Aspartokinase n=1 Tax=Rossellomorea pakistanensis TaxID=992288 RepID=A0ABS2NAK1_9BACI|nr:aspartate kinase [Bacillus pakistanensis]